MLANVTASNLHVRAGKMQALAVTGLERTPTLPANPAPAEAGITAK